MANTVTTHYVVKTDGLAAGKGVFVTESMDAALADVRAKLEDQPGRSVIVESGTTTHHIGSSRDPLEVDTHRQ